MEEHLRLLWEQILRWPVWEHLVLVSSRSTNWNVFSFAEYLAALALLLVILSASDFRFRYRLSLTRFDYRKIGFWTGLFVGSAILTTDVWFQNGLPIPRIIANDSNIKAALGFLFLALVFRVISLAAIRPPVFASLNAKQFFTVNYHYIHEGNADRLRVIAEELGRSSNQIFTLASTAEHPKRVSNHRNLDGHAYAHSLLLLIGDRRFCKVVVDAVPDFALNCLEQAQKYPKGSLPIFQFARNIGQEFIRNKDSAFYQEQSGHASGLIGYMRPATNIVFGSYEFVEKCATEGESPLDTDFSELCEFDATQMEGYSRAALAFIESYLKATKGRDYPHSYALARMLSSLESALVDVYRLNGSDDYTNVGAYGRLKAVVQFIKDAIPLIEKHAEQPVKLKSLNDRFHQDIFDKMAELVFETIFAASTVSSPVWTAWNIQNNVVWTEIFGFDRNAASRVLGFKVRRLIYREIKQMDQFPNFKGARLLGYCLNVLGLNAATQRRSHGREFLPLQSVAIGLTKANFSKLLNHNPKVAESCLLGSISYDAEARRLVKTFSGDTQKSPSREYLYLD